LLSGYHHISARVDDPRQDEGRWLFFHTPGLEGCVHYGHLPLEIPPMLKTRTQFRYNQTIIHEIKYLCLIFFYEIRLDFGNADLREKSGIMSKHGGDR
jgi:hypothetical protein